MKVFVYGGSGLVGGHLVEELVKGGHEVYAGSRKPESQKSSANLHWVFADSSELTKGLEVLEKVDAAYFLSPPGQTNQYEILSPWIEKAKQVGLKKLVLMTAMGVEHAPPEAPFRKTEILLEGAGIPWNIIRPNWFMQNFHTFWISGIKQDGKIYFPGGNAKTSFIDARDIASVAATLLTTTKNQNQAFTLTGPESIDHFEVAKHLTKVSGKEIGYVDVDPKVFESSLVSAGLSKDYAAFLVMIAGALKEGFSAPILDTVKTLTGKEPISFAQYAKDFANAWK
ncbi:NAD(P)H-binding protein [Leptospira kanakyensis]|uniref:NAD-dependent epimerase/dehydratase family protein n=1 Tax=Leptospira kanakyensis TaxID=2484968 RepID=A0A6N4PWJ3_9LEPT|nr:NAD(P)H-binding protein [Leptospira kanakyensis]MCW7479664.1 NAD(P)H-binding protein [Leptospira kanakyensis]TGK49907.1 NAD-dependent epimerase/dehydratase family protein [Leptospira kanakyensis]TGK58576.1 NAD-dependent epimerase/dehydratase family protein [Leptospira kanakyensis]TGK69045.1 NAD-dependent epimerase/dehydratase family protein [Leptospira kanakyensis]